MALTYLICLPKVIAGSAQGCPLQLTGSVTTIAGQVGVAGAVDGVGTATTFDFTNGSTSDGTAVYITDSGNNAIRRLEPATLQVTTVATGLNTPRDVVIHESVLYIANANGHAIVKYDLATGALTTVAGTGTAGHADGAGAGAQFNFPQGITTDGTSLYVGDSNTHTIRRIDIATAVVSTLAGVANSAGYLDGLGTAAQFNGPIGVTTDGTNVYVAENVTNQTIRKVVIATGAVSTIAGAFNSIGSADGIGTAARFNHPYAITTDGLNLYVTESANHTVRQISLATHVVTTLAGQGGTPGTADGIGTAATHTTPRGIATDGIRLYVSDSTSNTVRQIE